MLCGDFTLRALCFVLEQTDLSLTDLLLNSKLTNDYLCDSKLQEGRAGVSFNLTPPEAALTPAGGMQCPLPDYLRESIVGFPQVSFCGKLGDLQMKG